MALRLRTLLQILMAVLALGMGLPQPTCAATLSQIKTSCCCLPNLACQCHPDKNGQPTCSLAPTPVSDKKLPVRFVPVVASHSASFLFAITPVELKSPVSVSVARLQDLNSSPPSGNHPPQARLCLWLI